MTLVSHDDDSNRTGAEGTPADRVAGMAKAARTAARDAVETTREQVGLAYGHAQEAARDTGATAVSSLLKFADTRKGEAAGGLRDMSRALHRAAGEADDNPIARQMAEAAADACDTVAGMIEDRTTGETIDTVTRYGRENPATFAMGSLIAGFAIGRLLTAGPVRKDGSQRTETQDRAEADFGMGRVTGTGHSAEY